MYVELKNINKSFGDFKASDNVSFSIEKGKLIGLLGPSGSGKTNTLPLHVEILFNEFKYVPAFAVSSILVMMAIVILIIRSVVEYRGRRAE